MTAEWQQINVIFLMWDTWKNCKPRLQLFHMSHIREITLILCHSAVILLYVFAVQVVYDFTEEGNLGLTIIRYIKLWHLTNHKLILWAYCRHIARFPYREISQVLPYSQGNLEIGGPRAQSINFRVVKCQSLMYVWIFRRKFPSSGKHYKTEEQASLNLTKGLYIYAMKKLYFKV